MGGGHCKPPNDHNKTIKELEAKLKREKEQARKREEERKKKEEAEEQKKREQEEELRKKNEAALMEMEATKKLLEEQESKAKQREAEVRLAAEREKQLKKDMADEKRKITEEREALQRRFDDLAAEIKKREEEAAEAKCQEEKLRKETEEKLRRADEEREAFVRELEATSKHLKDGIQPIVYPTQEEYDAAKDRVEYKAECLHAAICGPSGSGKSSLINALRGLKPGEPGAAPVGIVETTVKVTRYPDPRTVMPYPRFIWFDVPGAGTFKVPAWKYFNQQGLFIFDFIVLVYDARFTQIDADVLENCQRFKIPALIVRSKATQHIENLRGDLGCSFAEARDQYAALTRKDLQDNLENLKLYAPGDRNTPRVYIVSRECVLDHVIHLEEKRKKKPIPEEEEKPILAEEKQPIGEEENHPIEVEENKPMPEEGKKPIEEEEKKPIPEEEKKTTEEEEEKSIPEEEKKPTEEEEKKPILGEERKGGKLTAQYIDEEDLVRDLLATAYDRRYAPEVVRSSRILTSFAHAVAKISHG